MRIFDVYKNIPYHGGSEALIYRNEVVSYSELDDYVNKYASYFQSIGVKKGDTVVISSPNCPEFIYTYMGAVMAGAIVVPLNLMLALKELGYIIKESGAKVIVVHPMLLKKIDIKVFSGLGIQKVIILDNEFKKQIVNHGKPRDVEINEDDICTYLYTSGTTGFPKGAMLTHNNLISDVKALKEISGLGPDNNFLCVLPMFHSFSWTVNVLTALYLGCKITIKDGFMPKEIYSTLKEEDITIFCGVPAMFAVLTQMANEGEFKALRLAVSGGAPLPLEVFKRFKKITGYEIIEGYGLSEASPVAILNPVVPNALRKPGSIGIPLPGIETKIVDEDDNELPIGKIGELVIKGPIVMKGYHNMPEESAKTLKNGWLHTGDLARKDEDGYYYIVDRIKDMIILSGFNVYPREIEEVLYQHPAVQDVAVVGVGDKIKGEDIKAFVVLKEGQSATRKDLQKFLQGKIASYKIPKIFEFVSELPKSVTGKVLKKYLK